MSKKLTPDEFDSYMHELAIQARNYLRRQGAFIEPEEKNERNHGYVKVEMICDELDISQKDWRNVKKKMLSMGEPITHDEFGGHYLGKPGSQAKNPAMLITRAMTMLETATFQIVALQGLSDWEKCQVILDEMIAKNRHTFEIGDIPQLLNGAGIKIDDNFERQLAPPAQLQ